MAGNMLGHTIKGSSPNKKSPLKKNAEPSDVTVTAFGSPQQLPVFYGSIQESPEKLKKPSSMNFKPRTSSNNILGMNQSTGVSSVDLTCICEPHEKQRAAFKVRTEHDVHANVNCPFRKLNRVQKWQLKAPS